MAKALFAPISIVGGLIAGMFAKKVFDQVWGLIDDEDPPDGSIRDVGWGKLLVAAAVQGAIFRAVKTLADRGARKGFAGITGTWPGDESPDAA